MFLGCALSLAAFLLVSIQRGLTQDVKAPLYPLRDSTAEMLNVAMQDPDAIGEVSIPNPSGVDLTQPWPGIVVAGWKLSITIKADVPVKDGGFTTVTRISYMPPGSVTGVLHNDTGDFAPMDRSWYPCSYLWLSSKLIASPGDTVNATCSSHLSNECITEMKEPIMEGFFGSWNSSWSGPHCGATTLPDTCRGAIGSTSEGTYLLSRELHGNGAPLLYFELNQWYWADDYDIHAKGDTNFYEAALSRVWVVGTAWGYSKNSEFANESLDAINGTIACLHAKGVVPAVSGAEHLLVWSWTLVSVMLGIGFALFI